MKTHRSLSAHYPFTGNLFEVKDGYNLHYLDEGKDLGIPTLFLHGNPTWSFLYRRLILSLREHGRCIAPDHIGCGLSDKPSFPDFAYDLRSHGNNIRDLVNHLGIDRFSLVLHDWGGAIGLSAFRNEPERVHKLVVMNTAAFPSDDVPKRISICRIPIIGSLLVRGLNGFAGPATFMAVKKPMKPEIKSAFLHPYDNWRNRVAVWRFVKDIPKEKNHPTRSLLQETADSLVHYKDTPVLACWGMRDFCFHGGFLKEWRHFMPHLVAQEFENSGHYLLEDDYDGCRSKIEPFLFG